MADYTTSGSINISGLSGTDFTEMIAALKKIEMKHATQLASWRDDWQKRLDAFGELRTALTEYSTYLKTMNTEGKFMVKSASVSNTAVLSVTDTTNALEGVYEFEVKQQATNSYANMETTATSNLSVISNAETTFTYGTGGQESTLTLGANTTLEGLKNLINNDKNNPGVGATILEAGGVYYLQLYSKQQGAGTDITVLAGGPVGGPAGGGLSGFVNGDNWTVKHGQDALVKINGFPENVAGDTDGSDPNSWLAFSGNSLSIYGMAVNFTGTGKTSVTVATDKSAVKENVETFVEETNKILSLIVSLTSVNENKDVKDPEYAESQYEMQMGSVLTGNYGVQLLRSIFKDTLLGQATGFSYLAEDYSSGDIFSSLAQIGIKTDHESGSATFGQLIFEDNTELMTLDKALDLYPEGVAELFSARKKPYTDSDDFVVYDTMDLFTKGGVYDVTYDVLSDGSIDPASIFINGKEGYVDADGLLALRDNSDPAAGIRILVLNKVQGTYNGTVRIKDGITNALIDTVDDTFLRKYISQDAENNGILSILETQYQQIINNIEDKIAKEDERIIKWERTTKNRFARLETVLKQYNNLQAQLESSLKQLGSSKD